ncbi:MAG: metallophosphoesterase [Phycisphaerae bacterium]
MASPVADIFRQAAELNNKDGRRQGNVVHIEPGADVVVSGDIHGNRSALGKVLGCLDKPSKLPRRIILQELIHGPLDAESGQDRSVELLLRSARAKVADPERVIFLMGNHDLAQISGNEIAKDGRNVCEAFVAGVRFAFEDQAEEILPAISDFLLSMPLAARTPGGTFMAHSLPSPSRMELAGTEILSRPYAPTDFGRGCPLYEWLWGRGQSDAQLDSLAAELGVNFFVLGHRHTAAGCEAIAARAVTLASDHEHGCLLHFTSDQALDAQTVVMSAIPLVALE